MTFPERDTIVQSNESEPIAVIGAGPAGLACAIALARAGRQVVVREWHRDVGTRFHGDFQGIENWSDERDVLSELAAAGIAATFDHHGFCEGTIYDPRGTGHRVSSSRPLFYLVRRGPEEASLDRALLRQAVEAGVDVRFGDRAGVVGGRTVLAIGPRIADAVAVGYVFDTDMCDGAWLAVDDRLAPRGYAYLLTHAGRGTVASCMFAGFKRQAQHVEHTVAFFRDHADLNMHNPQPFGGFANFRLTRTGMQGGHPVVGEQAGFQDVLAGFGIRYAIRSGLLAARSLIEGQDYTSLWRQSLLPTLKVGVVNRFVFNLLGQRAWEFALARLVRGDAGLVLRRHYRPSMASRLLFPLAQYQCGVLLRDRGCGRDDCQCVWCACRDKRATTALT